MLVVGMVQKAFRMVGQVDQEVVVEQNLLRHFRLVALEILQIPRPPREAMEVLAAITQVVAVVVLEAQEKRAAQMAHLMVVTVEMVKLHLFLEFLPLTLVAVGVVVILY